MTDTPCFGDRTIAMKPTALFCGTLRYRLAHIGSCVLRGLLDASGLRPMLDLALTPSTKWHWALAEPAGNPYQPNARAAVFATPRKQSHAAAAPVGSRTTKDLHCTLRHCSQSQPLCLNLVLHLPLRQGTSLHERRTCACGGHTCDTPWPYPNWRNSCPELPLRTGKPSPPLVL